MRHVVSKELFAYWSALKGARAAPDRSDIDPGAIRHILADTFIIEVDADRRYPLRLSGTRINALWLNEQKGRSFVDLWREDDRDGVRSALEMVVDGVSPLIAGVRGDVPAHGRVELELLLLPLRHFGKTHSRVLGALSPAYPPMWLGQAEVGSLTLVSMRVLDAGATLVTFGQSRHATNGRQTGSRPRLVVYEGSKSR